MKKFPSWYNCKVALCITRKQLGLLANRKEDKCPGIYVLYEEDSTICKIGCSCDIERRMRQIQTSNSRKLSLYAVAICEPSNIHRVEKFFHYRLRRYRTRGEWFNIHPYPLLRALCVLENDYKIGTVELLYDT